MVYTTGRCKVCGQVINVHPRKQAPPRLKNLKMLMRARSRGKIKRLRRLEGGAALWEVVK